MGGAFGSVGSSQHQQPHLLTSLSVYWASFFCAFMFAVGLVISGMTDPAKVRGGLLVTSGMTDPAKVREGRGRLRRRRPTRLLLSIHSAALSLQLPCIAAQLPNVCANLVACVWTHACMQITGVLDVTSPRGWDPTLMFVLGAADLVNYVSFR